MKALIIADNETVVKKIQDALENNGCDTIVYRWLLKALDNVIEIENKGYKCVKTSWKKGYLSRMIKEPIITTYHVK